MTLPQHLGKHFRHAYFGGSFSERHLAGELRGTALAQARRSVNGGNSVLAIVYHLHFYVRGVASVLRGDRLDTRDGASWETPVVETDEAWQALVEEVLAEGEVLAKALEGLGEEAVWSPFYSAGNAPVFTNVLGVLEHVYYHLGQIVLIGQDQRPPARAR